MFKNKKSPLIINQIDLLNIGQIQLMKHLMHARETIQRVMFSTAIVRILSFCNFNCANMTGNLIGYN